MGTKTFKASSMIEALQMVQNDLGPSAVVLSAREIPMGPAWSKWKRSGVEIVAAPSENLPKKNASDAPSAAKTSTASTSPTTRNSSLALDLADDATQIEWVADEKPAAQIFRGTASSKDGKVSKVWQPRRLTREEAFEANKQLVQREMLVDLSAATQAQGQAQGPVGRKDDTRPMNKAFSAVQPDQQATVPVAAVVPAGLAKNRNLLQAQGLDEVFLDRMVSLAQETLNPSILQNEDLTRKYFSQLLEAEIRALPGVLLNPPARVMCLVGASGSGKTTTTAKLAMFYGQQLGRKVTWICADTVRTGAIAQARAYTDALGLTLKLAYTPVDVREAVASSSDADLVLVDTPGYNPLDENQMAELGAFITEIPNRHCYLVASATTKDRDLYQIAASLGVFSLDGAILSKLDETLTFGSVYNFSRKSQLPMAYFTCGKEASASLQVANAERLVSALFGKGWNR
jgi:flagellar biosynthesis protein FlhF